MVERSLSMREAPGSIPGLSRPALHVGGLYSSVGQSARLVSARSGVRTSLEARYNFSTVILFFFYATPRRSALGFEASLSAGSLDVPLERPFLTLPSIVSRLTRVCRTLRIRMPPGS